MAVSTEVSATNAGVAAGGAVEDTVGVIGAAVHVVTVKLWI